MATYVPNVAQYLPELKPFTPDYKFLSNVLTTRQTKYDTNYKQLNNAYSRILYSDLSRQDTQGARDQFVNTLQPTLEKISGLDLSLAQNVKAANAVFEPFYQNDLVMKDMVYTKNFKDNVKYAQSLMYSNDENMKDKYWKEGIEYMAMKMEDFKNSSQDQALNMQLEQYVENPQLYKRSLAYLKEQGYDVEFDMISPDKNFIIKNKNGQNITKLALADLQMKFGKDPLINQAYYTKSYVDSRNYANNQMEKGLASSVSEGISQYNIGKLEAYKLANAAKIDMYDAQIEKYQTQLTDVEKEMKGRTPKPGSSLDLAISKLKNDLLGAEMERSLVYDNLTKAVELLNSGDEKMINSMGYSVEMNTNIRKDLEAAALNYSNRTAKKTLKVNQAHLQTRKEIHDVKMADMKFKNQLLLEEKKTEEYGKKLIMKKQLFPDGEDGSKKTDKEKIKDALNNIILNAFGIENKDPIATKEANIQQIDENYLDSQKRNIQRYFNESFQEKVNAFIQFKTIDDNSNLDNTIELPDGMKISEDIKHINKGDKIYVKPDNFRKLLEKDDNKEIFKEHARKLYTELDKNKAIANISQKAIEYKYAYAKSKYKQKQGQSFWKQLTAANLHNLNNYKVLNDIKAPLIYKKEGDEIKELDLEEFEKEYKDNMIKEKYPVELYKRNNFSGYEYLDKQVKEYPVFNQKKVQEVLDGKIPLYIEINGKKMYNYTVEEGLYETNIDKTWRPWNAKSPNEILNPELFTIQQGEEPEDIKNNNNILRDRLGITKNENLYTLDIDTKDIYEQQLEQLEKINKGEITIPEEGVKGTATKNNTGYHFFNSYAISDDLYENIGDLAIGYKYSTPLQKGQLEDPNNYEQTIKNAFALQLALKEPGTFVAQINQGDITEKKINDQQAFNFINNSIASYFNGELDNTTEKTYTIEYIPGNRLNDNSKYNFIYTKKGSKGKTIKSNIEITVPKNLDKNPALEENNPDKTLVDTMLDPDTNSWKEDFGYGGNINITKNGNTYNLKAQISNYDIVNDQVVYIDIKDLVNIPSEYTDPTMVLKARGETAKLLQNNENKVRGKQAAYQKAYKKAQEKNPEITWDDFIDNYRNN